MEGLIYAGKGIGLAVVDLGILGLMH